MGSRLMWDVRRVSSYWHLDRRLHEIDAMLHCLMCSYLPIDQISLVSLFLLDIQPFLAQKYMKYDTFFQNKKSLTHLFPLFISTGTTQRIQFQNQKQKEKEVQSATLSESTIMTHTERRRSKVAAEEERESGILSMTVQCNHSCIDGSSSLFYNAKRVGLEISVSSWQGLGLMQSREGWKFSFL